MSNSSPLPSSSPPHAIGRRDVPSPPGALAFLVHSQETVANKMPPDVDNKALARQKRRRTSKEDEDILKAEYLKNPKPDKAARLEIISRVALGEKEVQIWFQNRRQNDRRRARPLEPSSSASLMSSSSTMSDPPSEEEAHPRDVPIASGQEPEARQCSEARATSNLLLDEAASASATEPPHHGTEVLPCAETQSTVETTVEASHEPDTIDTAPTEGTISQQTASSSRGASQPRTSWISNRRSASFVRYSEDYAPEAIAFPNAPLKPAESPESVSGSTRALKRTHSFVRISTNEDGTARVVTDLDKTPSPPHPKSNPAAFSRAAAGLRRSYSAAGFNDRLAAAARGEPSPKVPKTSSNVGRSRDSRAWEFWCDPDSRSTTSLTTRAEQEGSGSAADAIGILRANRKILAQNHARQNTPLSRRGSHKVLGSPGVKKSRGPMQRASTISGRISGTDYNSSKRGGDETESEDLPQTESDKENWEPDVPKSVQRDYLVSTPRAARRARQILGENTDVMSQQSSIGAMLARERREKDIMDPEQDDELRSFMNGDGGSTRSSINSAEEAGCVEGLLKLSQGQWR